MYPYRQDPDRPTERDKELEDTVLRQRYCSHCMNAHMAKGWKSPRCTLGLTPMTSALCTKVVDGVQLVHHVIKRIR